MSKPSIHVYLPDLPIHAQVLKNFAEGASKFASVKIKSINSKYEKCDYVCTFGVYKQNSRGKLIKKIHDSHKGDRIIIERGFIRRDKYYMAGFNGLNGRADFRNENSDDTRWKKLGINLESWKVSKVKNCLLCFQVPWDSSVIHTNYYEWCSNILYFLSLFDISVVASFHPNIANKEKPMYIQAKKKLWNEIKKYKNITHRNVNLQESAKNFDIVVSYNSNSNVEATILGVPNFSFDEGSMVYDICNKDLDKILSPECPDRTQWANNIAYAQWTEEEMRSGECWKHLSKNI